MTAALPTLDIGEGALDYFFTLYKNMISQLDGYIVDTRSLCNNNNSNNNIIHFDRLQLFLHQVAAIEKHVLNERLWALTRRYPNYARYLHPIPESAPQESTSAPESLTSSQEDMELVEEDNLVIQNKFINLYNSLDLKQCECLNAKSSNSFQHILQYGSSASIESDSDEQLLIKLSFKEKVKLHSLVLLGEDKHAPAKVKLFVNKPV